MPPTCDSGVKLSHEEKLVLCCRILQSGRCLMPTGPHLMPTWSALMTPARCHLLSWQGQSAFDVWSDMCMSRKLHLTWYCRYV